MIFLKATPDLKNIFERLIRTMKVNVEWNGIFIAHNNLFILPGSVRSLFFDFDSRKVFTNVREIQIEGVRQEEIENNTTVINSLNMILYIFGKWGSIPGLKVEKDYAHLNALFQAILKDIQVEPEYRSDHFRFYKSGVQITYEDVIQMALEEVKHQKQPEEEAEEESSGLGLWHSVRWITQPRHFKKEELSESERFKDRLGNNFYRVGYRCPDCGEKLYMTVYPVNQEVLIETDEARVYIARVYTCNTCHGFFTPRPGKLIREGDVYVLRFAQDVKAYEDYLELMGKRGSWTANYKFNEYEIDYQKNRQRKPNLAEICGELEQMSEEELLDLEDKMDNGYFFPQEQALYYPRVKEKIHLKVHKRPERMKYKREQEYKENAGETVRSTGHKSSFWKRNQNVVPILENERKTGTGNVEQEESVNRRKEQSQSRTEVGQEPGTGKKITAKPEGKRTYSDSEITVKPEGKRTESDPEVKARYDARMTVADRLSPRQLTELQAQIRQDHRITEADKNRYLARVTECIHYHRLKDLKQKADNSKDKSYAVITRIMEEVEDSDCPGQMKEPILQELKEARAQRAQKEAEDLIAHIPPISLMDRRRYQQLREKLQQYPEADLSAYEEKLQECRDVAERQELAAMVKHINTRDRLALRQLDERLRKQDFSSENIEPVLRQIQDKIVKLDNEALDKICPDVRNMTFEEGLQAYDEVEKGVFLPELKANMLEMIDKRLTKMKMDECELLVNKLRQDLGEKISDSRLHYYEPRESRREKWDKTEAAIINCALETYASERGKYEYPIMICDASRKETGKEGFVLTPDHLFYNNSFSSERILLDSIVALEYSTGLLNRGVYVKQRNNEKVKIPAGIPAKEWKVFTEELDKFIEYLQEKPESRELSYLAEEKHEVKCCYRCGYRYRNGTVCPKCGNKENQ